MKISDFICYLANANAKKGQSKDPKAELWWRSRNISKWKTSLTEAGSKLTLVKGAKIVLLFRYKSLVLKLLGSVKLSKIGVPLGQKYLWTSLFCRGHSESQLKHGDSAVCTFFYFRCGYFVYHAITINPVSGKRLVLFPVWSAPTRIAMVEM